MIAISDLLWHDLIIAGQTILLALIGLGTILVQIWARNAAERQAKAAAGEVQIVKRVLKQNNQEAKEKLDGVLEGNKTIHTLVNSRLGHEKLLVKVALARVAELEPNPENIEAARLAADNYEMHMQQQHLVDSALANLGQKKQGES